MSCARYQALTMDHLDGLLSAFDANAVDLHLEVCDACSEERRQQLAVQSLLAAVHRDDQTAAPAARMWARLQAETEPETGAWRGVGALKRALLTPAVPTWAVALLLAIAIAPTPVPAADDGSMVTVSLALHPPAASGTASASATSEPEPARLQFFAWDTVHPG